MGFFLLLAVYVLYKMSRSKPGPRLTVKRETRLSCGCVFVEDMNGGIDITRACAAHRVLAEML